MGLSAMTAGSQIKSMMSQGLYRHLPSYPQTTPLATTTNTTSTDVSKLFDGYFRFSQDDLKLADTNKDGGIGPVEFENFLLKQPYFEALKKNNYKIFHTTARRIFANILKDPSIPKIYKKDKKGNNQPVGIDKNQLYHDNSAYVNIDIGKDHQINDLKAPQIIYNYLNSETQKSTPKGIITDSILSTMLQKMGFSPQWSVDAAKLILKNFPQSVNGTLNINSLKKPEMIDFLLYAIDLTYASN